MRDLPKFDLIFDNAGGIAFQSAGYCHAGLPPALVASTVAGYLADQDTSDWDQNAPEHRQEYDPEAERRGDYKWHNQGDVQEYLSLSEDQREEWARDSLVGNAGEEFYAELSKLLPYSG